MTYEQFVQYSDILFYAGRDVPEHAAAAYVQSTFALAQTGTIKGEWVSQYLQGIPALKKLCAEAAQNLLTDVVLSRLRAGEAPPPGVEVFLVNPSAAPLN